MSRAEAAPSSVRRALAPAKINLALHVLGRRPDGYHALDMLVAFVGIGDTVTWSPGGEACRLSVDPGVFDPGSVPATTANLAWGGLALAGRIDGPLAGDLHIEKTLPSEAGLGGGSSDAAAALRAILGGRRAEDVVPLDAMTALGADVPVCLSARPSRVSGIGERVRPVTLAHPVPVVLAWPGGGLSTARVFARHGGGPGEPIPDASVAVLADDVLEGIADLRNDLEAPARALFPAVGEALDRLAASVGCRVARMSGSGSCVVGYFVDTGHAEAAAKRLARDRKDWWVRCSTLYTGSIK